MANLGAFAFPDYDPETFEREAAAAAAQADFNSDGYDSDLGFDISALGLDDVPNPYGSYDISGGEVPYYAADASARHLADVIREYREIREKWYCAIETTPRRGGEGGEEYQKRVREGFMKLLKVHALKGNTPAFKAWKENRRNAPHALEARPNAPIFCTLKEPNKKPKDEYGRAKEREPCGICADEVERGQPMLELILCGHSLCIGCWNTVRVHAFETAILHESELDCGKCPFCRAPFRINGGVVMW